MRQQNNGDEGMNKKAEEHMTRSIINRIRMVNISLIKSTESRENSAPGCVAYQGRTRL